MIFVVPVAAAAVGSIAVIIAFVMIMSFAVRFVTAFDVMIDTDKLRDFDTLLARSIDVCAS